MSTAPKQNFSSIAADWAAYVSKQASCPAPNITPGCECKHTAVHCTQARLQHQHTAHPNQTVTRRHTTVTTQIYTRDCLASWIHACSARLLQPVQERKSHGSNHPKPHPESSAQPDPFSLRQKDVADAFESYKAGHTRSTPERSRGAAAPSNLSSQAPDPHCVLQPYTTSAARAAPAAYAASTQPHCCCTGAACFLSQGVASAYPCSESDAYHNRPYPC